MEQITAETVRELAAAIGITPREERLEDIARGLAATLAAIERCEALDLAAHEPATTWTLSGRPADAAR
jgi:hypothetical protein